MDSGIFLDFSLYPDYVEESVRFSGGSNYIIGGIRAFKLIQMNNIFFLMGDDDNWYFMATFVHMIS